MSKSTLADLRAQAAKKPTSYPTRVLPDVCLDQEATAEIQRIRAELNELRAQAPAAASAEEPKEPKRMGQGANPRIAVLEAEEQALWETMRPNSGELLLMGIDGGAWLRWKDDHPPREGNNSDDLLTFGLCNATELAADLGRYVKAWNGEDLGPDDWSGWMSKRVSPADQGAAVRSIVEMMETRLSVPKSPTLSSPIAPDESA